MHNFAGQRAQRVRSACSTAPGVFKYVLVNVNDDDAIYSDHPNIQVSLDVELKDSYLDLSSGDEIVVYYDGSIIDEKAETVYAITLRTPANRETQ